MNQFPFAGWILELIKHLDITQACPATSSVSSLLILLGLLRLLVRSMARHLLHPRAKAPMLLAVYPRC